MTTVPVGQSRTDAADFVRPRAVSAPHPPAQHERDFVPSKRRDETIWVVRNHRPRRPNHHSLRSPRRDNAQRFSVPARW